MQAAIATHHVPGLVTHHVPGLATHHATAIRIAWRSNRSAWLRSGRTDDQVDRDVADRGIFPEDAGRPSVVSIVQRTHASTSTATWTPAWTKTTTCAMTKAPTCATSQTRTWVMTWVTTSTVTWNGKAGICADSYAFPSARRSQPKAGGLTTNGAALCRVTPARARGEAPHAQSSGGPGV